jgi:hypothetical protein
MFDPRRNSGCKMQPPDLQSQARPMAKTKLHRGRPPVHPPEDCKRLMTRTTEEEYEAWTAAAEKAAKELGLPNLTIGPWSRMVLNQAARALGIKLPED